jgi:hypothetical protein
MHRGVDPMHWIASSHGSPPPCPPAAVFLVFFFFAVLFCCSLVNPSCLSFKLFVCDGDPFFNVLALPSLFSFFEARLDLSYYPLACLFSLEVGLDLSL